MSEIEIRFYAELNDFLPHKLRNRPIQHQFWGSPTTKDVIESFGIPHTEIGLVLINRNSEPFDKRLQNGHQVSVYPPFKSLDVSKLTKVNRNTPSKHQFILDVHLGKLSKYMRMMGFDTFYHNQMEDHQIIAVANQEGRIVLTRDIPLLRNGQVKIGYWLRSQNTEKQLEETLNRFQLHEHIKPFTRCIICNGLLKSVHKEDIRQGVPQNVFEKFDEFYQCEHCLKAYWKGSHFKSMQAFIAKWK